MDYCIRYVSALYHLLPQQLEIPPNHTRREGQSDVVLASSESRSSPHHIRYRSWVTSLIPSTNTTAGARLGAHSFTAEVSTSCSSFSVTVKINNVFCYTKVSMEVEASFHRISLML